MEEAVIRVTRVHGAAKVAFESGRSLVIPSAMLEEIPLAAGRSADPEEVLALAGKKAPAYCLKQVIEWQSRRDYAAAEMKRKLTMMGYPAFAAEEALKESGLEHVSQYVAMPGQSEHQTGLAMDVGSADCPFLSEDFVYTDAYAWLSAHAHEYGFIIRYTREGVAETGYAFEPWHIRYVGDTAAELHESGLTLEAWYRQRLNGSHPYREKRFAVTGW